MNFKRTIAAILTGAMLTSMSFAVYAEKSTAADNAALQAAVEESLKTSEEYKAFDRVAGYIADMYIDDTLTKDEVMQKGISNYLKDNPDALLELLKKMFESIDDYSEFFTAEEFRDYQNEVNQVFYGIGVTIHKNGDYVEITGFAEENSKAEQSGFKIGDKIYAVNGENCKGKSLNDVRTLIVGDLGTKVNITVLRGDETIDLTAERVEVKQSTVTGGVFEGNIGYISISTFGSTTSEEFAAMLDDFRSKGVKKIILDLRNNGGGLLTAAVNIARQIVPKGKIIDVVYRNPEYNVTYTSELEKKEFDIITLVNEHTASSSEILASAIQDSGAGKLVGRNTFGKGVIQQVYPLDNGMKFKLTIGEYKTRNGKEINNIGLQPDEDVSNATKKIDSLEYGQLDFKTRFALGDSSERIIAAKKRFSMLGYFDGKTEDTVFNDDLRLAVEAFQNDSDLCADGVLDVATQVKLEELFEKLETVIDIQMRTAYEMFGGNPEDLYKE